MEFMKPEAPEKDRYPGLVVMGLILLAMGGLCGLLALLTLAGMYFMTQVPAASAASIPQQPLGQIISAVAIYVLAAAWFLLLGMGTVLARRWARALTLVTAWFWLATGTASILGFLVFLMAGGLSRAAQSAADVGGANAPSQSFFIGIFAMQFGCLVVLMFVVPLAFVWFFRSPDVKATCDWHDPRPRWTDRIPLPVLGLALALTFGGVMTLFMTAHGVFIGLTGLITGVPAALCWLALGIVWLVLAYGALRRRMWAWAGTIAFIVLGGVYFAIASQHLDFAAIYRASGYDDAFVEQVTPMTDSMSRYTAVMMLAYWLPGLAFVVWTRRYFRAEVSAGGM